MDTNTLYTLVGPAREILMREWDPLGVEGMSGAEDEYDSYIPGVIALLQQGASVNEVAAHLDRIAVRNMGALARRERSTAAASALKTMWEAAARLPT
jgi:hypothetical protein